MPPAKSRKVLPSTSVRVAPVALSTKIGTTSVLARATTASLRAIQSREIGPGISVRIRIECSTCVSCVLERGRAPFDRHREPRARSPSHRTIRSGARGVDHGRLERHRPCDRRGSRRRRPRHLDRVARSRAGRARGRPPDRASTSADPTTASDVVASHVGRHGRLDVLVNAAGVAHSERVGETSIAAFDAQVALNLRATVAVCTAALPELRANRGLIVNVASILGLHGDPALAVYSATKHAIVGYSRSLGEALRNDGVRVTALCPGYVATPFTEDAAAARAAGRDGAAGRLRARRADAARAEPADVRPRARARPAREHRPAPDAVD